LCHGFQPLPVCPRVRCREGLFAPLKVPKEKRFSADYTYNADRLILIPAKAGFIFLDLGF
jgi:hypothetical protein